MKKLSAVVAAVTAAGVGLALSGTISGAATAAPSQQSRTVKAQPAAYTPPPLVWHACADPTLASFGSQCANLVVPLDYDKPNGKKITLAVSRLKHSSPDSKYQGPMLVNPGGPGGSGLIYSVFGEGSFIPGDGDITYDWIGFDPRGVGDSKPALTCDPSFYGYDRPPYEPKTNAIYNQWLNRSKNYADDCADSAAGKAGLLDHVKTIDTIKDMESLRIALNYPKINLYGFSYGTYLGQVYATMHPGRVGRFVLDGVVNPNRAWYQANLDQDIAFEKTSKIYFKWLAEHDDTFHLGTTMDKVRRGYFAEVDKLDKHAAAGGTIGGDELADVMLSAAYYVYDWVEIGEAYADLVNNGDASGIKAMYDDANPQTPGSDNGNAMYLATTCTDARWPDSLDKIKQDNVRLDKVAPFLTWGNAWFNGPCSYWPAPDRNRINVRGDNVKSKMLLIAETYDPATPFSGALTTRQLFPTSSLIEGVGGSTHSGSLSGVECTDNAIGRYLTNGTVPSRKSGNQSDLKCPPVPQPEPSDANALRKSDSAGTSALRQLLQEQLAQAQIH